MQKCGVCNRPEYDMPKCDFCGLNMCHYEWLSCRRCKKELVCWKCLPKAKYKHIRFMYTWDPKVMLCEECFDKIDKTQVYIWYGHCKELKEIEELKKENQELLLRPDGPFALMAAKKFYSQVK